MGETTLERFFREASEAASWADPLSRKERTELARMLASANRRFHSAATTTVNGRVVFRQFVYGLVTAAGEMAGLHLDVTERAAEPVTTREA